MLKASIHTIVLFLFLTGSLWGQSGFFRSYNHAPWFSDGQRLAIFNDSLIVGQSKAVGTTGYFGFNLAAYNLNTGVVVDSISLVPFGESFSVRSPISVEQQCGSIKAVDLTGENWDFSNFTWYLDSGILDSSIISYRRDDGVLPSFHEYTNGVVLYQPKTYQQFRQFDQHYDGVVQRYGPCGEFLSSDTIHRDTIGRSWVVPNFSDESKYLVRDQDRQNLMLLDYDRLDGEFVQVRPYADNELIPIRHYDDIIIADRLFYYERDGFDLYDETIAVFDDSLDLLWEAPFIPDRTDLAPSYWAESKSIAVSDDYITVIGAEGFDHGILNFLNRVNHLYCTRYSLDDDLIWHRKFDLLDSLLPNFWVNDLVVDDAGFSYAYGYYKYRTPAACDTCPVTRNTFLLKLDPDGYLNWQPTNVEKVGASSSISVYPNPATDQITISSQAIIHQVTLHQIDGRIAYQRSGLADQEHVVDVSNLSTGLYIVSVTDQLGRVSTSKVMVQ